MDNDLFPIIVKAGLMLVKSVGKTTVLRIFRHLILNQPDHVIERVFNSLGSGEEYNDKKLQEGDTIRRDWYFENDNNLKFVENMVRQIIEDTQGKKSEYITKFYVNIRFSSNDDIDEQTAFSYMEMMDSLSWRQLCIIKLLLLVKKAIVSSNRISEENIKNLPEDQRMAFHSISREYNELIQKGYISGNTARPPWISDHKWHGEPQLEEFTSGWGVPYYLERLHDLMNLHEIPKTEIIQTFPMWDIKFKS